MSVSPRELCMITYPRRHVPTNEPVIPPHPLTVSEASKRLPIAELPMRVESMGNSLNSWAGEAGKYVEKHAVSFSDTLMEYLTSAAGEAVKRSGELISTTIDSLERTVKGYLSDWIGCRPPPG